MNRTRLSRRKISHGAVSLMILYQVLMVPFTADAQTRACSGVTGSELRAVYQAACAVTQSAECLQRLEELHQRDPCLDVTLALARACYFQRRHVEVVDLLRSVSEAEVADLRPNALVDFRGILARSAARRGTLRLSITPSSARPTVFVDGRARDASGSVLYVNSGLRALVVEAPGFLRRELTLQINEGQDLPVTVLLEPTADPLGGIEIAATPAIADLYVDGLRLGMGSLQRQLTAGEHTLEARAPGRHPVRGRFTVQSDRITSLVLSLNRITPRTPAPTRSPVSLTSGVRPLGWSLLAVGAATGITGVVFWVLSAIHADEMKTNCDVTGCSADLRAWFDFRQMHGDLGPEAGNALCERTLTGSLARDVCDRQRTLRGVALGLGFGGLALLTAGVSVLVATRRQTETNVPQITAWADGIGEGVNVRWSF